jgi:hypothetical protein
MAKSVGDEHMKTACASAIGPKAQAYQFEDRLITRFASTPSCKGVKLVRYGGPSAQTSSAETALINQPHWAFFVDYDVWAPRQSWSLLYKQDSAFFKGKNASEAEMANDVCAIVLGQSGALIR